jgi:hypothetical protein
MRATEYLNATVQDLLGNDFLYIKGAKKSADYRILLPGIDSQVASWGSGSPGRLVCGTTYRRLYAACCRMSIKRMVAGHRNVARLHAGRYNIATVVSPFGDRAIADVLHHRTRSSVLHYTGGSGGSHG